MTHQFSSTQFQQKYILMNRKNEKTDKWLSRKSQNEAWCYFVVSLADQAPTLGQKMLGGKKRNFLLQKHPKSGTTEHHELVFWI